MTECRVFGELTVKNFIRGPNRIDAHSSQCFRHFDASRSRSGLEVGFLNAMILANMPIVRTVSVIRRGVRRPPKEFQPRLDLVAYSSTHNPFSLLCLIQPHKL